MTRKNITFIVVLLAAATMTLASCSKEHQCKCVTTDVPDSGLLQILTVDDGLECEGIKQMAIERHIVTSDGHFSLERIENHTVKCREYGE